MAGAMPMPMHMQPAAAPAAAPAADAGQAEAEAAPAEEPKGEKKIVDVTLKGFDAAAKIKLIKELRTLTPIGLKEAKDLVERAPTVLKEKVKREEAEEWKKKLEAVGAQVELE